MGRWRCNGEGHRHVHSFQIVKGIKKDNSKREREEENKEGRTRKRRGNIGAEGKEGQRKIQEKTGERRNCWQSRGNKEDKRNKMGIVSHSTVHTNDGNAAAG